MAGCTARRGGPPPSVAQPASRPVNGSPSTAEDAIANAREAAVAYFEAVGRGDAAAAERLSVGGAAESQLTAACARASRAQTELYASSKARFGEGHAIGSGTNFGAGEARTALRANVEVHGDRAVVNFNSDFVRKVPLFRVRGGWKVDVSQTFGGRQNAPGMTYLFSLAAARYESVTSRIEQGGYATADDATSDLNWRMKASALGLPVSGAATRPATRP